MANYFVLLVDLLVKYGLDKFEGHGTIKEGAGWFLGDALYEIVVRARLGNSLAGNAGAAVSQVAVKSVVMTAWEILVMIFIGGDRGRHRWLWSLINNTIVSTADIGFFKALDWYETAPATA
jgi:hypothetical protein